MDEKEVHAGGRPSLFNSADELEEKIEVYKKYLATESKPPTLAGMAYYTGIDRKTLYNYSKKDEFFPVIKKFVDWILMNFEEIAIETGGSGIIFILKQYGYSDKSEVTNVYRDEYDDMSDKELDEIIESDDD